MNPIINGTAGPVLQPPRLRYDPTRGQVISLEYESAGVGVTSLASLFQAARINYDLVSSGFKSRLIAEATGSQLGYPDVSCDEWQILANEIQKDIKEHPDVLAMEEAYPGTIGYVVRDAQLYEQGLPPGTPAPPAGAMPISGMLFSLLVRGSTHYACSQYVVQHQLNVSNAYAANIADVNVERIYTTAQLLSELTNAALWTFPLPPRLVYKLGQIPAPPARTNYLWGWRKLSSKEITCATNRISISTEYWLEQWGCPLPYKSVGPPTDQQ